MRKTAFIILMILALSSCAFAVMIADKAPDFEVTTLSDKKITYKYGTPNENMPVYLYFWATW